MSTTETRPFSGDELFAAEFGSFRGARRQNDLFHDVDASAIAKAEGHDPEVEELLAYIGPLLSLEFYDEVRARVVAVDQAIRNVPFQRRAAMTPQERLDWSLDLMAGFLGALVGYTSSRGQRAISGGASYLAAGGAVALSPAAGTPDQILEVLRGSPSATLGAVRDYARLLNDSVAARSGTIAQVIQTQAASVAPDATAITRAVVEEPGGVVVRALDQWVYRWRNVGAGVVARALGKPLVAFNNPPFGPDGRTSSYCRWVHLQRLDPAAVQHQIDSSGPSRAASAIFRAWPFVGNFSTTDGPEQFKARVLGLMPRGLGLPPYHFGCRTQVRVAA